MNQKAHNPGSPGPEEKDLDAEIHTIRAEISTLAHRKRILTTSLLTTPTIKSLLRNANTNTNAKTPTTLKEDLSPLATAAGAHSSTNHHRIAFGATAFPFKDPAPNSPAPNLLGVRIDICARGRFVKPYYVLLRQEGKGKQKEMKMCVHRHTIPAFIAVDRLAGVYLASSSRRRVEDEEGEEEGEGGVLKSSRGARRQDLRGRVGFLREKLGLDRDVDAGNEEGEEGRRSSGVRGGASRNDLGIVGLEATAVEARYVRMEWEDGRLGRFKLSNAGLVERAVFMNDRGRDKVVEDAVTGGGGRIESLFERLKELEALEARS
ncbi:hypothetical protein N7533_000690 [Penicillium manginii]|uniref:uncharacterized protein n=1 Tax=Penicillium manginii TaxID=203109 RepID=UPI0025494200|nr:uncharacterized protein N7533_000690 [Penicillium manginii]KAJ5768107.1 hypothetical protein N7533_000690 [Penicillium manginii]